MGRRGNTIKYGHGQTPYTSTRHCTCGRAMSCQERRYVRHIPNADKNKCARCNEAVAYAGVQR